MWSPGPLGNYNCLQFLFFSLKNVQPAPWTTRQRWHCLRAEESPSSGFGSAWGACPAGLDKSPPCLLPDFPLGPHSQFRRGLSPQVGMSQ